MGLKIRSTDSFLLHHIVCRFTNDWHFSSSMPLVVFKPTGCDSLIAIKSKRLVDVPNQSSLFVHSSLVDVPLFRWTARLERHGFIQDWHAQFELVASLLVKELHVRGIEISPWCVQPRNSQFHSRRCRGRCIVQSIRSKFNLGSHLICLVTVSLGFLRFVLTLPNSQGLSFCATKLLAVNKVSGPLDETNSSITLAPSGIPSYKSSLLPSLA